MQSSAALLERQRNPGVGYWSSRHEVAGTPRTTEPSPRPMSPSRAASPAPSSTASANEEEVNLEYLRNVILQFLEHKEMGVSTVNSPSYVIDVDFSVAASCSHTIHHSMVHSPRNPPPHLKSIKGAYLCIVLGVYTYNWKHASVVRRHGFKVPTITLNDEKLDITSWSPSSYSSRFSPLHWFSARLGTAPS